MFNPYAVSMDYASWIVPFGAINKSEFNDLLSQRKLVAMIETTVARLDKNALYERGLSHGIILVHRVLGMIFEAYNNQSIEEMKEKTDDFYKEVIVEALEALETFMNEEDAKAAEAAKEAGNGKRKESFKNEMFRKLREQADKKEAYEKEKKAAEEQARADAAVAAAAAAETQNRRDDPFLNPEHVDTEVSRKQAYEAHQAEEAQRKKREDVASRITQEELKERTGGSHSSPSGGNYEDARPLTNKTSHMSSKKKQEALTRLLGTVNMEYARAFGLLNDFTKLFYNECETKHDNDFAEFEKSTTSLSRAANLNLSKNATALIHKHWQEVTGEWKNKYAFQIDPSDFFKGIEAKGPPTPKDAGLAFFIEAHFPGAWDKGRSITMSFGRHLFEMKRYFIERLVERKVTESIATLQMKDTDQCRKAGLKKFRFSSDYLEKERRNLNQARAIKEAEGKEYQKHRTRVELKKTPNGKRKKESARQRQAELYAINHSQNDDPQGRYIGLTKNNDKEIWWGEKAQTDWLFLA